jgi:hypothetical protein
MRKRDFAVGWARPGEPRPLSLPARLGRIVQITRRRSLTRYEGRAGWLPDSAAVREICARCPLMWQ